MRNSRFAARSECIRPRPAYQNTTSSQREHSHDIKAGSYATVSKDRKLMAHGFCNGGKCPRGGWHTIKLPTAMVRNNEAIDAKVGRLACISGVEDSFED